MRKGGSVSSNIKGVLVALFTVSCLGGARTTLAWGPVVHVAVTAKAIDTLPGELKDFYKDHRREMPTLSLEQEVPEEGPDHRFAIDRLVPFPFNDLPRTEAAVKAKFGEKADEVGRLPWLIDESYDRLVEDFKAGDRSKIMAESDILAGLVTDINNPLAVTENADGQKTGQGGLWVRFSDRFPEAEQKALKLDPDAARYLDDPREYVFSMIRGAYVWVDNILYREDLARRASPGYSEIYYSTLADRAADVLKARLSDAASDVGSYWYTAWTVAGRPKLK
jgi:hypothetical protein